jgi:tetratricopeptide (TPR) repeat protein
MNYGWPVAASERKRKLMRYLKVCLVAALWTLASCAAAGPAADAPPRGEEIYQQTLRSTAWVKVYQDSKLRKMGTGFLVDRVRKLLITNQHVVDTNESVEVVFPLYQAGLAVTDKKDYIRYDRPIRGWVLATDPTRDLAVIELEVVPHAAAAMHLASDSVCPGEPIHLIGNPGTSELLWVYNSGMVHQVSSRKLEDRRNGRVLDALTVEIRTRASVKPGFSGGPAVNERGELAGVATMSNPAANWAWCVDIAEVRDVLRIVRDYPKAARRLLNPQTPGDFQDRQAYYRRVGPADHAIAHYSEILGREPENSQAFFRRGAAYARHEEWDKAIADFTAAVRSNPNDPLMVYNRAVAYSAKASFDPAIADFRESLRLDPKNALAYLDRGLLYSRKGMHDSAITDFDSALRLHAPAGHELDQTDRGNGVEDSAKLDYAKLLVPDLPHASAYNSLAWVWAASSNDERRNGKKAVEYATKACELSGWKNASYLSTLAAAHAECGNFADAIRWQDKAILLAREPEKTAFRARVELYRAGKPFRDRVNF